MALAEPSDRRRVGRSKRDSYHLPRPRKLSVEQEAAIHAAAGNWSLRELAADYGVSHETVRAVSRGRVDAKPRGAMPDEVRNSVHQPSCLPLPLRCLKGRLVVKLSVTHLDLPPGLVHPKR